MTGVDWLLQYFPHRDPNVFFNACGLTHATPRHKQLWDASVNRLHRAIEHTIHAGGRNFICRNYNLADYTFMDIVSQFQSIYPEIRLNICYRKEVHRINNFSDKYEDIYKSVDRIVTVFADSFVTQKVDYLECLVTISGQVIGLVRPDLVERGRLIRLCKRHHTAFINVFAVDNSSQTVTDYTPPSNAPDIQSLATGIMQDIISSPEIDEIYQAWQRNRSRIIMQLQQNDQVDIQLAKLFNIDVEYQKCLKEMFVGCGTRLLHNFIRQQERVDIDDKQKNRFVEDITQEK